MAIPRAVLVIVFLAAVSGECRAGYVYGIDSGSGPGGPRPASDAALGQYLDATAVASNRLITSRAFPAPAPCFPSGKA